MVLCFALLLGLTVNLYKPLKTLTQKKVVNPNNIFVGDSVELIPYATKNGIIYDCQENGSWHIYGTSTAVIWIDLTQSNFTLEAGKTYTFSQGLEHPAMKSYYAIVKGSDGTCYVGDLDPKINNDSSTNYVYGSFTAKEGVTYSLTFRISNTGAVIDETFCPVLVEGTEAGEFYIYK